MCSWTSKEDALGDGLNGIAYTSINTGIFKGILTISVFMYT